MKNAAPRAKIIRSSTVYRLALLFLILLTTVGVTAQGKPPRSHDSRGSSWDRYKPATIREIKAELIFDYPDDFVGFTINSDASVSPYRIKAKYLGDLRPILSIRRQLIRFWFPDFFGRLFKQELLLEAEGERIWMPVQSSLIPDFQNELERGDMIQLFIMAMGTIDNRDRHEWVFIINEFASGLKDLTLQTNDHGGLNSAFALSRK